MSDASRSARMLRLFGWGAPGGVVAVRARGGGGRGSAADGLV